MQKERKPIDIRTTKSYVGAFEEPNRASGAYQEGGTASGDVEEE